MINALQKRLAEIPSRQKILLGILGVVVFLVVFLTHWTFPMYDHWRAQSTLVAGQQELYARLLQSIEMKDEVDRQVKALSSKVFQLGTDEAEFSAFLTRIEAAAGPLLVRVEPYPTDDSGNYTTYRVKLLLAGKIQEITQFTDKVLDGEQAVGMESFSLRAIQGRNQCESTFVLWMVKLKGAPRFSKRSRSVAASIGDGDMTGDE